MMRRFVISRSVDADPSTVFGVFTDHRGYARLIGPIRSAVLEREGTPPPNGTGAIRKLRLAVFEVREEVTDYDLPSGYSYRLLSGVPVEEYSARVQFGADGLGTRLRYEVRLTARGRLRANLVAGLAHLAIAYMARCLAVAAESIEREG